MNTGMLCMDCLYPVSVDNPDCKHSLEKFVQKNFSKNFSVLKKVLNHLKIYGYEIDYREIGKDIVFDAAHKTRIHLTVIYVKHGFLFNARFPLDKNKFKENEGKIYKTVVEMNRTPDIVSFTIDKGDFVAIAWYPNYYTKSTFDDFLEMFTELVNFALRKHDDFLNFLLTKN